MNIIELYIVIADKNQFVEKCIFKVNQVLQIRLLQKSQQ